MNKKMDPENEEKSLRTIKTVLISGGGFFSLVGIFRQWPVADKTYLQFIEGDGYMSLILGLIMIVLGFSVRLLAGEPPNK